MPTLIVEPPTLGATSDEWNQYIARLQAIAEEEPDNKRLPLMIGLAESMRPPVSKYSDDEPRDYHGRWTDGGDVSALSRGLIDKNGVATDKGMGIIAAHWIAGDWSDYQTVARGIVNGSPVMLPGQNGQALNDLTAGIIKRIDDSPALDYPLYRGLVGVDYKVGDTFSESLTTWTAREELARDFSHDEFGTAGSLWAGQQPGIVVKVAGTGMHGVNISDINPNRENENIRVQLAQEHLTSGRYRVTSISGEGATRTYNVERIGNAQASDLKKVVEVVDKYSPDQPRDYHGRWTDGGGGGAAVLFEVSPNPDNKQLQAKWDKLSDTRKQEITDKLGRRYTPMVLDALGVQGNIEPAMGGFEGQVNPSLYMNVNSRPFDVAGAVGDTFGQKAMVVMSDRPGKGLSPVGMVSVIAPGADEGKLRSMQGQIGSLADGFTYHNGRMQILNFSGKSNEDFAGEIDRALGGNYIVEHATVYSAYIEEHDYVRPSGERARSAWGQVRGHVRAAFSQSLAEELQKTGSG